MDTLSDLGPTLRALREARHLSLAQAATRGGLSKSALAHWEAGRRTPPAAALAGLLDALAVPGRERARLLAAADPQGARILLAETRDGGPIVLGEVLRAMRLRRGLDQADVARAVGRSQPCVARWERGDDEPGATALHDVLFALGASSDEIVAVASLDARGRPTADPGERYEAVANGPHELGEALWLGLEADLWWRAGKDAAHDEMLQAVRLQRADWYAYEGRFGENLALAGRAMAQGHRPPADKPQAGAYGVAWTAIRTGRRLAQAARLLEDWEGRIAERAGRSRVRALRALVLAERNEALGRAEAEAAVGMARDAVGMAEDAAARWFAQLQLARVRLRHGDPEGALAALDAGERSDLDALTIRAQASIEMKRLPPSDWLHSIRSRDANRIPLYRDRLRSLERDLARLVR